MARQRLGVVLLVPQPLATQIDGVRRALGDEARERIAPHITLVPPVNVAERDLPRAFTLVRTAASTIAPLALRIGPVATFAPVNPVAYLQVGGEPQVLEALERLRAGCLDGPLERESQHEFVPHVTVANELSEGRLEVAARVLADFSAEVTIDHVHVLAELPGRLWRTIADAPLGERPAVVGRGSLPLDISVSGQPDVEAAALLSFEESTVGLPFAVTARRDGAVVAAAWGWSARGGLEVADLVVAAEHRGQGISRHLVAAVVALARRRGCVLVGATAPRGGGGGALLAAAGFRMLDGSVDGPGRWELAIGSGDAAGAEEA
ncbi:MAG: GNAT family N-acetyltransferase [Acidimicrobiales bacterium]